MAASLDDLAVIDHDHVVRIADGAQPVRAHKAGAPFHQAQQHVLDVGFRVYVHTARGFVQDQNRWVG